MLAEYFLDEKGKTINDKVDAYDEKTGEAYDKEGKRIKRNKPRSNPAMTLTPQAAGDLASFIETITRVASELPIIGDLGASGYDPISVVESGRNGARLLSAITNHPAPVVLWTGPGKKVLGGMKVTVAKELGMTAKLRLEDGVPIDFDNLEEMADPGHIRVFADPNSFEAVLDPPGWKGIKFYKDTVNNVASILEQEQQIPKDQALDIATKMVDQVIAQLSTIERAATDGSFTAVVGADKIRSVMAREIEEWYRKKK
jgi:hypothetical protein